MTAAPLPEKPAYPATSRGLNNFSHDANLERYLARLYPGLLHRQRATLESLGAFCAGQLDAQAEYSDRHAPPVLRQNLDNVIDPKKRHGVVLLNIAYKDCQQELYRHGVIAKCFDAQKPESHMLAFVAQYMVSYSDISTGCPLAMTHPVALLLETRAPAAVRERFLPQFLRTDGGTMVGATWATEWAGGSDIRANTKTVAVIKDPVDGRCLIDGKNFFTSAAGFDSWGAIKTVRLGQGEKEGIGLAFVPRFADDRWDRPESARILNNINVTHLKDKSGTHGLATAEIELEAATGYIVAGHKDGLRAMMEALSCSRVHNAMAAAGVMHRAYVEAMCWAANRHTFGKPLIEREDIQEDLLRLKTEWLGGAALAFEAARTFDSALENPGKKTWLRVVTALAKYRTAETATACTGLATEIIGGSGYAADHPIERIHRDAMVLRVWEGPKNIQARELAATLRQGGDAAFITRLDHVLKLLPAEMGWEKARLQYLRDKMKSGLEELKICPEREQIAAPRFMEALSKALTYALLCEEAGAELKNNNDCTKQMAAAAFYDRHYTAELKPSLNASALQKHFNAVARGLPIPPAPVVIAPAPSAHP